MAAVNVGGRAQTGSTTTAQNRLRYAGDVHAGQRFVPLLALLVPLPVALPVALLGSLPLENPP